MPNTSTRKKTVSKTPIDPSFGHLQPQALDIEKAVLGALMIDKDAFSMVSEMLHPESFYDPRHQKIYLAIQTLNMDERPVDFMTVSDQLERQGDLETVGGAPYIMELSSLVASSANIEYHAHIIAQKFLARQLIHFASEIETKAFDATVDVDSLMQEAEGALFELSQKNMRQDFTQIDPVIKQAVDAITKASANDGGITGIPSGYTKLDEVTSGWQRSDLIIIAGRPAMGKTSFALSLAKNAAVDYKIPVGFFSLEMNNVQLVNRLISNTCRIKGSKILNGQLAPDEWERLDKNLSQLTGSPIYIDDTPGLSVFELRTKARRLVREKGVQLIMIDYLQLAKELNIPIIALSQLNRTVENREGQGIDGKRPQLSDLRESGAIEQDADMVVFVHRPEYYHILQDEKGNNLKGMAQIIIAKHRKGATKDVLLTFKGEYTTFLNPEENQFTPLDAGDQGGEIIGSRLNGEDIDGLPTMQSDVPY